MAGRGRSRVAPLEPGQGLSPGTITNSLGMKFALIKAGEFQMGSPDTDKDAEDAEKPQHRVRITRPFYLGVHEVTRGQFRQFVDNAHYQTEAEKDGKGGVGWNEGANNIEQNPRYTWREAGFEQTDLHPVVNVSWNDALAFAKWLSKKEGKTYRLPTEAEWEYASRAGTTTRYFCGDDAEGLAEVANVADGTAKAKHPDWTTIVAKDGFVYTSPVGHYRPNAWGLYDMHGNVLEWCWDCYGSDFYEGSRVDDPAGLLQAPTQVFFRVFRGGSWDSPPPVCRSANRFRNWRRLPGKPPWLPPGPSSVGGKSRGVGSCGFGPGSGARLVAGDDYELTGHKIHPDQGRRVPDGVARYRQGGRGQRETPAPGADHPAVLPGSA